MRCEECSAVTDEYIEHELDERTAAQVAEHIKACTACAGVYQQLRREREIYAHYLSDVEATPRLWTNLRAGIEAEKKLAHAARPLMWLRPWFTDTLSALSRPCLSPALATALVVIAVGVTAGVMKYMNSGESVVADRQIAAQRNISDNGNEQASPNLNQRAPSVNTTERRAENTQTGNSSTATIASRSGDDAERSSEQGGEQSKVRVAVNKPSIKRINSRSAISSSKSSKATTPDQLVREAEQRYQAAVELLSRDLSHYRTTSDPAVVARLEHALAEIDRNIAKTKQAVRDHPGDPVVAQYMMSAYRKKIEVLQEIASERRPE